MLLEFQSQVQCVNEDRTEFDDFLRRLQGFISVAQGSIRKLLTRMQWPCISPIVKVRLNINVVKSRRHIRYDPEDEPKCSPGLSHNHRDVFACQSQRNHAPEVEHPIYNKCAVPICDWIAICNVRDLCVTRDWVRVGKVDLEGHGNEGVCEG